MLLVTFDNVTYKEHGGLTTNAGRGKSFAELDGIYRAKVQALAELGYVESPWTISTEVTAIPSPDTTPGPTVAPTLTFSEGFLMVAYADPSDTGNSPSQQLGHRCS